VSKATGVPLAKLAARIMAGERIADFGLPPEDRRLAHYCVKEAVMPWGRFPGADVILGPEMKSTGEVMGVAMNFPEAYAKSQLGIGVDMPSGGTCFVSVCDRDKRAMLPLARDLVAHGFKILATEGTARALNAAGIPAETVRRIHEEEPNIATMLMDGEVDFVINTPFGPKTRGDMSYFRTLAVRQNICHVTTMAGAEAFVAAIDAFDGERMQVYALQDL
jgi:carbamoyl-phosphate synthase large subunit